MDETAEGGSTAVALEQELRERNRELAALNDLALAVGSSLELDETLRAAVQQTLDLMGVCRGGIALVGRDGSGLVGGVAIGIPVGALIGDLALLCASRGTPLMLPDTAGREDVPVGYEGARSGVIVPLKSAGRTVGVLTVLDDRPKRFSQHDLALLTAVASLVGPAVENAGLFADLSDKVVEVTALNAIAHSISKRLELPAILDSCLSETRALVPFERASVVLLSDEDPSQATVAAVSGSTDEPRPGAMLRIEGTLLAAALTAKRTTVVSDLRETSDRVAAKLLEQGVRSWVIVPLLDEERAIGTLDVGSVRAGAYGFRQVSILEGIAGHLSVAVSNARLYESLRRRTLELEALARETQHRVQNNLQMIAGLVSMIGVDSAVPAKSIARCLSQIQAISVIHEMLSCEQDIGDVGLKESIDRIAKMAAVAASGEKGITIEVMGENVRLPSRFASAVGIAINELVTNAIEHGFRDRDHGRIRIQIRPVRGLTEILVQDDGVGLPDGFALDETRGSGLGVLNMLLRQGLGATLEMESKNGTLARILIRS